MPSTDPLDAADFNPTAHINRLFPNEESLSEVDTHVSGLQDRMRELDEEVLRTVRQQTSAGSSARSGGIGGGRCPLRRGGAGR